MPVVNDDWRDPASWKSPSISYGIVKDGEQLHFSRRTKSGSTESFSCSLSEWEDKPKFRMRLEKDQGTGAWLAIGLEPHRVMIRQLDSPLKDKSKSAEIWGTLLDAAIPFSIEKCHYTFLPRANERDSGLSCLAVAARLEDLEHVVAEWVAIGLNPDLIFPEELMLSASHTNPLWKGLTRTVFVTTGPEGYTSGGGAVKRDQRDRLLSRFLQSREPEEAEVDWHECGPEASRDETRLEDTLAKACFKSQPFHANLLANFMAPQKLKDVHGQKAKTLKASLLLLVLLMFLAPLLVRHKLRVYQKSVRSQISDTFLQLTGSRSNAPGQELLLANRFLEDKWGALWNPVQKLREPLVSFTFVELSQAAADRGLVFSRVELMESKVQVNVLGTEPQVISFMKHLEISGWEASKTVESNGTWRVNGEKRL